MIKEQLIKILPLLALLFTSFLARADFTGPPQSAVNFVIFLIIIGLFLLFSLIYWILNSLLSLVVSKKIDFPWVQSLITIALFAVLSSSKKGSFMWDFDGSIDMGNLLLLLCIFAGWSVGFMIAPPKKNKAKDIDVNS